MQRRMSERVDVMSFFLWHAPELGIFRICVENMVVRVIFRLQDNSPSCWEDTAVNVQLVRLEEVTTENWDHGQILSIWKMHNIWRRCHYSRYRRNRIQLM